jgi:hypothetical protein
MNEKSFDLHSKEPVFGEKYDYYNRLKQYVDFNWSPEELTGRLTLPGLATPPARLV